ncbi:FAD-dependent oxidoreductase [Zavarzinia aquatilis]|uniref:Pyridine nucleotide-disulfide oxidoreductase n=1 Tax=Zavarzinia aquatilis TaxID=2211142 RepID=A0A317EH57_9PROT|nr:FAD-dependent oxidoreductase [Zavarzinia aquatilis]PWR24753.1 pyridine nucleotide-disulfide oxidoreductase [Zavarzinia aquatilis]
MSEDIVCDVAIVGGGPAGLAAAAELRRLGAGRIVVLERTSAAGGMPLTCVHSPFGLREYGKLMRGAAYARELVERADREGVEIRTGTAVFALHPGGVLAAGDAEAPFTVTARRVLLATGAREAPRSARLVSGARPLGIFTTGALQNFIHAEKRLPFRAPLVVGSELVSFSALITCRQAGIRPVAMIEAGQRTTARWPAGLLPRLLGVPLLLDARITKIAGGPRVTGVEIEHAFHRRSLDCDGILFTGKFTPEASLARLGPLAVDPHSGGPIIDQFGRCSDPAYYAAGNMLHPIETAGFCWREAVATARRIYDDLAGLLPPAAGAIPIEIEAPLSYAVPQLVVPAPAGETRAIQLRVSEAARGRLCLRAGDRLLWSRRLSALPERRILVPLPGESQIADARRLRLTLEPAGGGKP